MIKPIPVVKPVTIFILLADEGGVESEEGGLAGDSTGGAGGDVAGLLAGDLDGLLAGDLEGDTEGDVLGEGVGAAVLGAGDATGELTGEAVGVPEGVAGDGLFAGVGEDGVAAGGTEGVPGGGAGVATVVIATFIPKSQCVDVPQMKYLFPIEFRAMTVFPLASDDIELLARQAS